MESLIENLINGNLKKAKQQARIYKNFAIRMALIEIGYSPLKAALTANWLKGKDCYQAACDAD